MDSITLMRVPIIWTNFAGKEGLYNAEGKRTFNIRIDDEVVAFDLLAKGWNIKEMKKREEDDPQRWHLPVKVNYDSRWPPRIFKTNEEGTQRTLLDETTVQMLDLLRVQWADVTVNPFPWESPDGKFGISAYVDTMYAVTEVNPLDEIWEQREAESLFASEVIEE
jgi:hypothetical protein